MAGNPHARCRCKTRYGSKFTAASRCSPCDSTAFLLHYLFLYTFYSSIFFSQYSTRSLWLFCDNSMQVVVSDSSSINSSINQSVNIITHFSDIHPPVSLVCLSLTLSDCLYVAPSVSLQGVRVTVSSCALHKIHAMHGRTFGR